jgi:hypothetical protein
MPARRLALLAVAALLLATHATAQVNANATLTIDGLADASTNETVAVLPFTVTFAIDNLVCVGQGATISVALAASGDANATATVEPAAMTFIIPVTSGITGYSHTQSGTVTVRPAVPGAANHTAALEATVTGITGCAAASADGPQASANATVAFLAPRGGITEPVQEMPAPGLALLASVVAALALVLRRRA